MTVPLLPQLAPEAFDMPDADKLAIAGSGHPPRILILYGSLRPHARCRLQLVHGDDWAGTDGNDFTLHLEVIEDRFEQPRI